MKKYLSAFFVIAMGVAALSASAQRSDRKPLAKPEADGIWLRPAQGEAAQPIWGFVDGIRVGIAPLGGPRGLLRIYTPYMGQPDMRLINFMAIEPIPAGDIHRGLSELEHSKLDDRQGKRFWSSDDSLAVEPLDPTRPARGVVSTIDGEQALTVYIFSEPFDNGAKVYVRLRFYASRPHEFEMATFARNDSKPLRNCILTATMGNWARLRNLYLRKGEMKVSTDLWPDYTDIHFAPHDTTAVDQMIRDRRKRTVYFIAAPNEMDAVNVTYDPKTTSGWFYQGDRGTQYWYKVNPDPELIGLVNGRYCYWAGQAPIPGGIAYENFELVEPFKQGATFVFGIAPMAPEVMIKKIKAREF
ncbi:MAG: hypothetical protein IJC16_02465 [Rikenellaceae bacterium]|nr:hypothetical protein [Rikenellaceae bacterium]